MSVPLLKAAFDDGVLTLTLNRPERLNALTETLHEALGAAIAKAEIDPHVKVLVLTGEGRSFCAGYDLKDGQDNDDDDHKNWTTHPRWLEPELVANRLKKDADAALRLHEMPKITIAKIRGAVAGSGLVLATACDFRIASRTAIFKTAFASAGRCGDPGGAYFVTRLVGPAKARELYLIDERIDAQEAQRLGLVNWVVDDDQLDEETNKLTARFAKGPQIAYGYIKQNLNAASTQNLSDLIRMESMTNARASLSRDAKEAAMAFFEKRLPVFEGR